MSTVSSTRPGDAIEAEETSGPPSTAQGRAWQGRRDRRARVGRSQVAIAIIVVIFFVIVAGSVARRRLAGAPNASAFRGAFLGMTASDLRARFAPGAAGHWAAATSSVGEEALVWSSDGTASDVGKAVFEFHDRILVAVRADVAANAPEASEPARTVTAITVRAVDPAPDRTGDSLTILARDCPTHAPEVARLVSAAH